MESTPECVVNYLQFVDCALNAAKQNEELQDRPQQQENAYLALSIDTYIKITVKDDK